MNKSVVVSIGSFVIGAVLGAVGSGIYFKTKYEKLADEEIESVVNKFSNHDKEESNDILEEGSNKAPSASPEEYEEVLKDYGYSGVDENGSLETDSDVEEAENIEEELAEAEHPADSDESDDRPFIIEDDEQDKYDKYDTMYLTLYLKDKVLVDDTTDEVIYYTDSIGSDNYFDFLGMDEDEVYVVNPKLGMMYNIIKSNSSYREMMESYHGGMNE